MNGVRVEGAKRMGIELSCERCRSSAIKILDEYYRELWENDCEIIEDAEFLF